MSAYTPTAARRQTVRDRRFGPKIAVGAPGKDKLWAKSWHNPQFRDVH
jgi:hypothetical protein